MAGGSVWGRYTRKPGKLYVHVFDWPKDGKLLVPGLVVKVTRAYPLGSPDVSLAVRKEKNSTIVTVSAVRQDPFATVVVLESV